MQKRSQKFLERKEIETLIGSIKPEGYYNLRDRALFEVLWSTGLRIAECLALPDAPFIKEIKETIELSITGKGGYTRPVYFSLQALRAIKAYLAVRKDSETLLFPFTIRRAQQIVKDRALDAGFEEVHPHSVRHSYACNMLKNGVNLYYLKEFLGHHSLSSTQQYLHFTNRDLLEVHKNIYGNKQGKSKTTEKKLLLEE